MLVHTTEIS